MAIKNRKRNVQLIIRVTEEERALIEQKMVLLLPKLKRYCMIFGFLKGSYF